jgi:hypothetical protein
MAVVLIQTATTSAPRLTIFTSNQNYELEARLVRLWLKFAGFRQFQLQPSGLLDGINYNTADLLKKRLLCSMLGEDLPGNGIGNYVCIDEKRRHLEV